VATVDLIKKLRKIEIKSKGLSNQLFSGEYHSAFKGRGMAFSEVREYQPGDDIRTIDWNVTARFNHPFIKVYEEEREMTVMLVVDVSGSENFGTEVQLKKDLITELCATLAFSTITNNDKVGVLFFSDKIEKFIPPKKGKSHVLFIIRELIDFVPKNNGTNIGDALKFLNTLIKKRSTIFLISDFNDANYDDAFKVTSKKHDLVVMKIKDRNEQNWADLGLVKFKDPETGNERFVDTSDTKVKKHFFEMKSKAESYFNKLVTSTGTDFCQINTRDSYVKPLMTLFKRRGAK
jgi:uncharacterized protein (DUF58 family)